MRTIMKLMALVAAAMALTVKAVWESGRWVLRTVRSAFAPPVGAGAGIEQALEDGSDLGTQIATAAQAPAPAAANDDAGFLMPLLPEAPYDPATDWGLIAKDYMRSRVTGAPEPSLSGLDEAAEAWLRGLTDDECLRLHGNTRKRIADHIFGSHLFRGIATCHERSLPAIQLADVEHPDEARQEILDDLATDPDLVPGYLAPKAA